MDIREEMETKVTKEKEVIPAKEAFLATRKWAYPALKDQWDDLEKKG